MALGGSQHESGAAQLVAGVQVGPVFQQQLHHLGKRKRGPDNDNRSNTIRRATAA